MTNENVLKYDFGQAVFMLKRGIKMARLGWNGSGMFAVYSPGGSLPAGRFFSEALQEYVLKNGGEMFVRPCLLLKTAQNDICYWTPSASDVLAEDWVVVQ